MPTYEYECGECGFVQELVRRVADRNDPAICPCQAQRAAASQIAAKRVILTAPMGQADLAPYIATAGDMAGKPITSRREHREYLKRNKLREVGTDLPKDTRTMRGTKMTRDQRQELRATIRNELRAKVPRHILEKRG
jgi:putative FmdB family regulatory protein